MFVDNVDANNNWNLLFLFFNLTIKRNTFDSSPELQPISRVMTGLIFSNQASVLKRVTFSKIVFDTAGSPGEN
jgi:hypothetical protein